MNLYKWFKLLITLAGKFDFPRLVDLPDLQDSGDTQAWTAALLDASGACAELTPTEVDDEAVKALQAIVEDDQAWQGIFTFLQVFVAEPDDNIVGVPVEIAVAADNADISPAVIFAIIQAIAKLLAWLRDRKAAA